MEDLKAILLSIAERLDNIDGNTKMLAGRLDAIEPEITSLHRKVDAAAIVAAETNEFAHALHRRLAETTDRHGSRLHALEQPNGNGKAAE